MIKLDLIATAKSIAERTGNLPNITVIEKELLHYEILHILDKEGLLETLTFQGGTCLRLCYGGVRYSEDLDFAGGFDFDFEQISSIKAVLEKGLNSRYDIDLEVLENPVKTDDSGFSLKRWQIKVVTARERPDIPLQRISLEVASVPAHTRNVRPLNVNYEELPPSYENTLVIAESLEEICADKLKAFLTARNIRYRDLWDLRWMIHRPRFDMDSVPKLFALKVHDYDQAKTVVERRDRVSKIPEIIESEDFVAQMKRFLPTMVFDETIARKLFRESLTNELIELYEFAFAAI